MSTINEQLANAKREEISKLEEEIKELDEDIAEVDAIIELLKKNRMNCMAVHELLYRKLFRKNRHKKATEKILELHKERLAEIEGGDDHD